MNIFVVDNNPVISAQSLANCHVIKMVLESCQLLCTCHQLNESFHQSFYKPTHKNHPCTLWLNKSKENYRWLYNHFIALCDEYTYRYYKIHKSTSLQNCLFDAPQKLPNIPITSFALCMPEQYKRNDAVESYRLYYKEEKASLLKYTIREKPQWLI